MNITSIKRKKATLDGMANVLNEFLYGVSKGFQDAAFASFSRRRSTVRADIAQSFSQRPTAPEAARRRRPRSEYLDMLKVPAARLASAPQGVVDVPQRRGPQQARQPRRAAGPEGGPGRREGNLKKAGTIEW